MQRPTILSQFLGDHRTPLLNPEQCQKVVGWIEEKNSSHFVATTTLSSTRSSLSSRESGPHIPYPDPPSSNHAECPETTDPTLGHSEELLTSPFIDSGLSAGPLEAGQEEITCSDAQIFEQPRSHEGDGGKESQEVDDDETQLAESPEEDQGVEAEDKVVDDIVTYPSWQEDMQSEYSSTQGDGGVAPQQAGRSSLAAADRRRATIPCNTSTTEVANPTVSLHLQNDRISHKLEALKHCFSQAATGCAEANMLRSQITQGFVIRRGQLLTSSIKKAIGIQFSSTPHIRLQEWTWMSDINTTLLNFDYSTKMVNSDDAIFSITIPLLKEDALQAGHDEMEQGTIQGDYTQCSLLSSQHGLGDNEEEEEKEEQELLSCTIDGTTSTTVIPSVQRGWLEDRGEEEEESMSDQFICIPGITLGNPILYGFSRECRNRSITTSSTICPGVEDSGCSHVWTWCNNLNNAVLHCSFFSFNNEILHSRFFSVNTAILHCRFFSLNTTFLHCRFISLNTAILHCRFFGLNIATLHCRFFSLNTAILQCRFFSLNTAILYCKFFSLNTAILHCRFFSLNTTFLHCRFFSRNIATLHCRIFSLNTAILHCRFFSLSTAILYCKFFSLKTVVLHCWFFSLNTAILHCRFFNLNTAILQCRFFNLNTAILHCRFFSLSTAILYCKFFSFNTAILHCRFFSLNTAIQCIVKQVDSPKVGVTKENGERAQLGETTLAETPPNTDGSGIRATRGNRASAKLTDLTSPEVCDSVTGNELVDKDVVGKQRGADTQLECDLGGRHIVECDTDSKSDYDMTWPVTSATTEYDVP
ncbi:unnamed protein product, partial [Ranitomeya imitator]